VRNIVPCRSRYLTITQILENIEGDQAHESGAR